MVSLFLQWPLPGQISALFLYPESATVPRGKVDDNSQLLFHCLASFQNLEAPSLGCLSSSLMHISRTFFFFCNLPGESYGLAVNDFNNPGFLIANPALSQDHHSRRGWWMVAAHVERVEVV